MATIDVLKKYFSNRLINTLGSKAFHLIHQVDGVGDMFENKSDLVYYSSEKEMNEMIEYYLKNDEERNAIALNGYTKMRNYTFDNISRRIINGR